MDKILVVIIHNIRSAYNVGSIFRTSEGAGVKKIYLTGYTPAPFSATDPYMTSAHKMIAKTALGAEKKMSWEKVKNISLLIRKLKKENFLLIGLEKTVKSKDISRFHFHFPVAMILGNEVRGISRRILLRCDEVVSIPMRGEKESLNVSVAAGIAIYRILE